MKNTLFAFLFLVIGQNANAQMKGVIYGISTTTTEHIVGATLHLLNADKFYTTDEHGGFEIVLPKELPDTLVITATNYTSDTVILDKKDRFISMEIHLFSANVMDEVVIGFKKESHTILRMKTLHVEEIGEGELRKAACCNLSESFETNASVDVNITDAVSGAKKIQMLGIDGVYTQIQMENIPHLRGLESSFGLNAIPGTWIKSIQITKGTGTVVNGYESMAGLVNLEYKKPHNSEKIFVNAFGNIMGRAELNLNGGFKISEKLASAWFAHGSGMFYNMDHNDDGFRDLPMGNNLAFANRYHYNGERMESQFGFSAYQDQKFGGQTTNNKGANNGAYGVNLLSSHFDAFAKTGFFLGHERSLGVIYHYKYQDVSATFGDRKFKGIENRAYLNMIFDSHLWNEENKIKTGISGVYADFKQDLDSLNDDRTEIVPGAFMEHSYTGPRLSSVAGFRADYHNLYGLQMSPRYHGKFSLNEYNDIRYTVGKGWRVPNYMIDNISLLANSNAWILAEPIKPESAINYGGSFVHKMNYLPFNSNLVVDFFRTEFQNQLIVDRDAVVNSIVFRNMTGVSYSNSFQAELFLEPIRNFELRFAYKLLDVKANFGGELQQQVMVPKHRGFVNVSYKTRNKRWEMNTTCSVFGTARLPIANLPDGSSTTTNVSEVYPMLSAQVTHVYKKWDFYVGGENLTNYTQQNPIIDAENPFSSTFNATRVWAPIMGINVYAGVRYAIKQKRK